MDGELKIFRWGDIIIMAALIAGAVLSLPFMLSHTPESVQIFKDSEIIAEYPLNQDKTIQVQGKLGEVTILIKQNAVAITKSTCPHHLCIEAGKIRYPGTQIVCAPNHIMVSIKSLKKKKSPDGIAR